MMKIAIKGIVLTVGKKTLSLSVEEARGLFNELNNIFGPKYTPNYTYPFYSGVALNGNTSIGGSTQLNGNSILGSFVNGTTVGNNTTVLKDDGFSSLTSNNAGGEGGFGNWPNLDTKKN